LINEAEKAIKLADSIYYVS